MRSTNPVLKKLGLADTDRLVIFHADDIGNFQSSLDAYRDLLDVGLLSSASTMVPCPWFPATAAFCRANAGRANLDMGVHLTVTSEWTGYRWGPIQARDAAGGLIDEDGYFHSTSAAVQALAQIDALGAELRAQIQRALAAGIDVTHIDSHMFALLHPRLVDIYVELSLECGAPPFLFRQSVPEFHRYDVGPREELAILSRVPQWEDWGIPLFDDATMMPLDRADDRAGQLLRKLDNLKPGLTFLILHPTKDTPELREAVPDSDWPCRAADYLTFLDEQVRDAVDRSGVHVIGFRALRSLMPAGEAAR